jgi:hypothetical protein
VFGEGGRVDPRRLLPALAVVACVCLVVTVVSLLARTEPDPGAPAERRDLVRRDSAGQAADRGADPAAVLAAWDVRRAAAWADGDPVRLRDLYVQGSRAGAADVRLLRRYLDRGLTVRGLRTQVLGLEVLRRADRRLVLLVTDRTVGGEAVGAAGTSVGLPADRASTRRVVLVRAGERWLVDEARAHSPRGQASAAASTSRTSSSSKS